MPRVHVQVSDWQVPENAEDEELWEQQLERQVGARLEVRDSAEASGGVRRFGGSEAIDRKRAERRKKARRR